MTLIEQLRSDTKEAHLQLDHYLYPVIQQIRTVEDYAKLLQLFYGFFDPVYDVLERSDLVTLLPDWNNRRKPEWILQDLTALGKVTTDIPICKAIPDLSNQSAMFGCYYVLEGSTMGGSIISRKISENLGTNEGLTFFTGYGENNRSMWNIFLETLTASQPDQAILIDSAQECFVKFKNWLVNFYG